MADIQEFIERASAVRDNAKKAELLCRRELRELYANYSDFTVHGMITNYRNALRAANLETPFLQFMREPQKKMEANHARQRKDVYARQGKQRPLHDPDTIVAVAERMLETESYITIGLGISLLTGRREYETFVTGQFQLIRGRTHHVRFSGQAKTRNAVRLRKKYIIPVLCDPVKIVDAITRLRAMKDFSRFAPEVGMVGTRSPSLAFQIHVGSELRRVCTRYFKNLIPDCSPHDLRRAYAVIAYDWFAPEDMSPNRYIAEILGHDENDLSTAQSYQDFYLATPVSV